MALWGNNDNVDSTGIVTCNYSTRVVTGSGTSFGETGSAQVGDDNSFRIQTGDWRCCRRRYATY